MASVSQPSPSSSVPEPGASSDGDFTLSEANFRRLADSITQLAWMAKPDGWIFWYNLRWYEYTGKTPKDMEGWGWQSVHHPETLSGVLSQWQTSIATGLPFDMTFPLRGSDGVFRPFLTRIVPFRDETGAIVLWFGTNTDVSEHARLMQDRDQLLASERSARSIAEHANRMKDEFLATLSHELRTPLNAILGWAQLLRKSQADRTQMRDGLDVIERNARMQAQLIEDLLDMSRIISGKLRLDVQSVHPATFIDAAIEAVQPAADAKEIRLIKVVDGHAGPISGDASRLQQVVWNLLSNAIKFTPKGGKVQILLERVNSHIELSVSDNGPGISPPFLPFVFDRFRQQDASTTRVHGGLGLGLAIVKQLVELHGGTVQAKSGGINQGATFVVELPLKVIHTQTDDGVRIHPKTPLPAAQELTTVELKDVAVLVVDDEADARDLIRLTLGGRGAEVAAASSAEEALALLRTRRFDVIVSDIGMPGVDGYELLRRVRALPAEQGGGTPAVALTAFARSEDRTRALRSGYLAHVAKPVEPDELMATIAAVTRRIG